MPEIDRGMISRAYTKVVRTMLIHEPRFLALILLFLGADATGDGARARADDANPPPAPGRMFVVGRVLDAKGQPVPGATVAVYARSLALRRLRYATGRGQSPIGDGRANASGRFRVDVPRTSSSRDEAFGVVALAPGQGVGWVNLDPDDDQPTADIALRPEQAIHGRLFDLQGRPVPDVTISVGVIRREDPRVPAGSFGRRDGISYGSTRPHDYPAWPRPVKSDSEGRFVVSGVGRALLATLAFHHPRFAIQTVEVETDGAPGSKSVAVTLVPAQIVNVRVTYADTEEPVAHAPLQVSASRGRVLMIDAAETDAEGRARVHSWASDRNYGITAYPPIGQPYLIATGGGAWPKGALEQTLNIALPRAVLIHGKVTEEGSGKPDPGAWVDFLPREARPNGANTPLLIGTDADGSFRLGVDPRPGDLCIKGLGDDHVLQSIGSRITQSDPTGGRRLYAHAHAFLDLKQGVESQEVNLVVRRGVTVSGRVVGPDGQPVRDAQIISRIILDPSRGGGTAWSGSFHGKVRDGRFAIHGLDPDAEVPVYFLEPKGKLGAVVNLSGKSDAGAPVIVRLEPCGAARARVVDPGGKPVAVSRRQMVINMVVTPGLPYRAVNAKGGPLAEEIDLDRLDPLNYKPELVSDADGRITLPELIPGATYRFIDYTTVVRGETGPEVRKEFTVKPGETVDLGDIRIEKPPR
jgi:hypothetical protein